MRALGLLSTVAFTQCGAEFLELSSLLQLNHLRGEIEADIECRLHGRCKTHTTTTTTCETVTPPPELAPIGICTISGDPHIKPFDSNKTNVHYYYNGDYYLVKSDFLVVQARYWSTAKTGKSAIKALAVGGHIMEGSILTIEPQNGNIKLDGEVVNLPETGSVAVGTGMLTSSADTGAKKQGPLVTLRFANDDVTIKAKRMKQMMNAVIEMRPEKDQDGHCGNFNGNVGDDTLRAIKGRMGKPLVYGETMFPIMAASLRGCAPKKVGQKNIGQVFGQHMNVHECNMMCSQRGTPWMAVKDGVCSCTENVPSVTASAECEASCVDDSVDDLGFCAYELAKPAAVDTTACLLNEAKVVKACTVAFSQSGTALDQATANIESCKIDACSTGDLAGTLAYLQDWDSVEKKERMKLRAQKKKERALGETNRKEKGVKRKANHAAKKEQNEKNKAEKENLRKQRKEAELNKKQKAKDKKAAKKAAEKANKQKRADEKAAQQVAAQKRKDALEARKKAAVAKRKEKVEKTTERREKLKEKKTKRVEQLKKKVSP